MMPKTAMLLAAGLGTRMQPLTDRTAKALVRVQGKPLIDWSLERLEAVGVTDIVVNLHHFGARVEAHVRRRWKGTVRFSPEERLLDTGGGVARALPLLGESPFFVINADTIWLDGQVPALERLARQFDAERMDALLLCAPTVLAVGYEGPGDFVMASDGRLARRPKREIAPFVYGSVQLVSPSLFAEAPEGPFSTNLLWDRAIAAGRLHGLRHEAPWFDVGRPHAIGEAERVLYDLGFRTESG